MDLKQKTITGTLWNSAERFSVQGIQFIISIFLTRLLTPEDYGIIGIVGIVTSLAGILADAGLSNSLIRQKETDEEDYATVFIFNLAVSGIIYVLIFFAAPIIASFFDQEVLINIIRVLGLGIIISAFSTIQMTRLSKAINFKKQFQVKFPSVIISGVIGLVIAILGFGVWSLVWYGISQSILLTSQLWFLGNWRPKFSFSFKKLKYHLAFGLNLTAAGLINGIFTNAYNFIIGKFMSPVLLGYYNRADTFRNLPVLNISTSISVVSFPAFAQISGDNIALKRAYKRVIQIVMFWLTSLMVYLIITAEIIFKLFFGVKWMAAIPYFQLLSVCSILYPLAVFNGNIIAVKNKSDLILKLEIAKKTFIAIILAAGVIYGIYGLLIGQIALSIFSFIINAFFTNKLIDYNIKEQIWDVVKVIYPAILLGIILMFYLSIISGENLLFALLSSFLISVLMLIAISFALKIQPFMFVFNEAVQRIRKMQRIVSR